MSVFGIAVFGIAAFGIAVFGIAAFGIAAFGIGGCDPYIGYYECDLQDTDGGI
jgi:hypothetical protein